MFPKLKNECKIKIQPDEINLFFIVNETMSKTKINDSAYQILKLCNGENNIDDIKKVLENQYNEKREIVEEFVNEFIEQSLLFGTIECLDEKIDSKEHDIIGSKDYWTPELIIIELTYNCLLNCVHCYADAGKKQNNDMNSEILEKIIDEIIELGIEKVQLTGGEPLIYKNINNVIRKLVNAGIYVNIITSGMFENEIYESLKMLKNNKGSVQVSIDGLENTHNKYRNNDNSFKKAIKLINFLVENEINVTVATTYIDQEIEEIINLCEYVRKLKVPFYRIGMVMDQGRAIKNSLDSSNKAFEIYNDLLNILETEYNNSDFRIVSEDLIMDKDDRTSINCGAGYKILKISPDFSINPCLMIDYVIGSLRDKKLKEFLLTEKSIFSNIHSPSINYCINCENKSLCKNCIAQGLIQSKNSMNCEWKKTNNIY